MYDAAANTLSWVATILGMATFLRVLFTYDRVLTLPVIAVLFAVVVFVAVRQVIESRLTSQQLATKAKQRCLLGIALAAAAWLLIATNDDSKIPADQRPTATQAALR
ncbi:MAG TPA: hypothetical protein VEI97_11245 [bacterium]|nr:hypothetical protein [bacterium]